jgi:antitoxin (DNA-binding transcriptional repressor) of toxin-antitoxin stability system
MNKRGNPKSLIASQPGNLNAVKQGVHSPRLIQARAAEIAGELAESFEFSPRLAVHETARCIAILEAIDRDLDERGLVDKKGEPRYLLNHRSRTSRQLEHWLEKVSAAIERQTPAKQGPSGAELPDYVRALQRIALGQDATATAHDQVVALKQLVALGAKGTTSYLERPAQSELTERANAVTEAKERRRLERQENQLKIADAG